MLTLAEILKVQEFLNQTGGRDYFPVYPESSSKSDSDGELTITVKLGYEEDPKTGDVRIRKY